MNTKTCEQLLREAAECIGDYVIREAEKNFDAAAAAISVDAYIPHISQWIDEAAMRLVTELEAKADSMGTAAAKMVKAINNHKGKEKE